jgi:YVTN family beta-propeller protein
VFCLLIGALLLGLAAAPGAEARNVYVLTPEANNLVVFDSLTNQLVGSPISVPPIPQQIAITPDGRFAYLAHTGANTVTVVDLASGQTVGVPIPVGEAPSGIGFTPDGHFAYVANNNSSTISVIDTQTRQVVGTPISSAGSNTGDVAVTPDGKRVYVAAAGSNSVSVIDTSTNKVIGPPITVGSAPDWVSITPDGRFVYVANEISKSVSVIATATNKVVGSSIPVGELPHAIAITPDGKFAYVANYSSKNVSVIATATNKVVGSPIPVGILPNEIAITPDGKTAYVTNTNSNNVSVIDTATNAVVGSPIPVGERPEGIAIAPDQPPRSSFTVGIARPGVPVHFDASSSSDPDGTIANYQWAFGDGGSLLGPPNPTHVYGSPGAYTASLTLTDNEGCSTTVVFTGQTASCNGGPAASATKTVVVVYPGVRLHCPKSAKPGGCKFRLQVLTRRHRGMVETALASAKVKAGHSKILSLRPKAAFAEKLASTPRVFVKETVITHRARRVRFGKLKIVQ